MLRFATLVYFWTVSDSCSKFPSFNQTMEESDQWTHFAPIAKLESLDEIDQDSSRHSTAGLAVPMATTQAAVAQPLLSSSSSPSSAGGPSASGAVVVVVVGGSSGALSVGAAGGGGVGDGSSDSSSSGAVTK